MAGRCSDTDRRGSGERTTASPGCHLLGHVARLHGAMDQRVVVPFVKRLLRIRCWVELLRMLLMIWVCSLVEAMARSGHSPVWMDDGRSRFEVIVHKSSGARVLCQGLCGAIWLSWGGVGARLWEQIGSSSMR
jgi:hypothetical protein